MQPKDWTLLVIASALKEALMPVQLQKSLFLISKNVPVAAEGPFYQFVPYDYGPFNSDVYADAAELEDEGLVVITRPPQTRYKTYRATDAGKAAAERLRVGLPENARQYVAEVVNFTQSVTFNQLVSAIYKHYPEMKANSVFKA